MTESFNQKEFTLRVNEELKYLGMEKLQLAKSTYIKNDRMLSILKGTTKLRPGEIKSIADVLGMN